MQFTDGSCAVHRKFTGSSCATSQEVHVQSAKASNIKHFPGVKSVNTSNVTLRYKAINNNNLNDDDYINYLNYLKNKNKHGNTITEVCNECEVTVKGSVQPVGELITIDEAVSMLGRSRRMVYQYIKNGKLRKEEKVIHGRKRTLVSLVDCEALCEELGDCTGIAQEETDTSHEADMQFTEVAQEEEIVSQEIAQEVTYLEPAQQKEETKYLIDVWAEVDRRIEKVIEPYKEQLDMLAAQNKLLLERLKGIEELQAVVDKFITEWREDKRKREEKKPWWAFWS